MIVGHAQIIRFFENALRAKRLAHAYCFVGPKHIGKRAVAEWLSAQVLSCAVPQLHVHPDYSFIERTEDEKTGKIKKELSVAQAREIKARLQRKSWVSGWQVTVINEAELLNEESANALLKTLEEPAPGTLIVLLCENEQAVLPTVRSRVQMIHFSLVPETDIRAALTEEGYQAEVVDECVRFAAGRPGVALTFARNDMERLRVLDIARSFERILREPVYKRMQMMDELIDEKEEPSAVREQILELVEWWLLLWQQKMIRQETGKAQDEVYVPTETISRVVDELFRLKQGIRQNVNTRLLLEHYVMQF